MVASTSPAGEDRPVVRPEEEEGEEIEEARRERAEEKEERRAG